MKTSSAISSAKFIESASLSDREALRRMIQYAWAEAEKEGVGECAELLAAALVALDLSGASSDRLIQVVAN